MCLPATVTSWSLAEEALDFCEQHGMSLDPWQKFVLRNSLGLREDGQFAAREVGLDVARQNGKGAILEARELIGIYLVREELVIHSAHEFATAQEHFLRLEQFLEANADLSREVRRISKSHGDEGIYFTDGRRIRFRTRTSGGGRGWSCDCLVLDEAMILKAASHGALVPTQRARRNPQRWYTGSAVDQFVHDHGLVFSLVRRRGHAQDDPQLAYFEWSAPFEHPDAMPDEALKDPLVWAQANPALGIRIDPETIEHEIRSLDRRSFAVELLGVGDWPDPQAELSVIDLEKWDQAADPGSLIVGDLCFAFDVSPARSSSSIAASGMRSDGFPHVELVDRRPGTGWVVERLAELWERHEPRVIVCDNASPAGSLLDDLRNSSIAVEAISGTEYARACSVLFDKVEQGTLRHLGQPELRGAVKGAKTRKLGEAWAWARGSSAVDITPLVASSMALWAAMREQPSVYEEREAVAV